MVEAERRGQEIEKKLDTDSVGAETACLIVKHYGDGGGTRGAAWRQGHHEVAEQPELSHSQRRNLRCRA